MKQAAVTSVAVAVACRSLVDRANDWLHENNDVEVKSCETVTWLSHDAASLSAGSELMLLSKRVAPPAINTHCYRGLRYGRISSDSYQSINQSFICIRPMVHIKEEKKK